MTKPTYAHAVNPRAEGRPPLSGDDIKRSGRISQEVVHWSRW
jgi:hypothetical protein